LEGRKHVRRPRNHIVVAQLGIRAVRRHRIARERGCRMPPQQAAAARRVDHLAAVLWSSGGEGPLWLSAAVAASSTDVS
jgi:hypothetical protein